MPEAALRAKHRNRPTGRLGTNGALRLRLRTNPSTNHRPGRQQPKAEQRQLEARGQSLAEGLAYGRSEGRVLAEAAINSGRVTRNERRLEAEANSELFDEPPPRTTATKDE